MGDAYAHMTAAHGGPYGRIAAEDEGEGLEEDEEFLPAEMLEIVQEELAAVRGALAQIAAGDRDVLIQRHALLAERVRALLEDMGQLPIG